MQNETCLRCGLKIEKKGHFCPNCGFFILKEFSEKELFIFRMDIQGFTSLTEKTDVFEMKITLSLLFSNLRNLAELHGGYVNQYIGDEIEIIWGLVKTFNYEEFLNFYRDAKDFLDKDILKIRMKMKMFGGYGKAFAYPVKTGLKAYLLIVADFIQELNEAKNYAEEKDVLLIGEIEKVFPLDSIEKVMIDDKIFYKFNAGVNYE